MNSARCIRPGRDLTLVLDGAVREPCLQAAAALSRLGIEAELIELPPQPGDEATLVLASVHRTGRLACVAAAGPSAAAARELVAQLAAQAEATLMRPVLRMALPAEPLPADHLVRPLLQLVAGPRADPRAEA